MVSNKEESYLLKKRFPRILATFKLQKETESQTLLSYLVLDIQDRHIPDPPLKYKNCLRVPMMYLKEVMWSLCDHVEQILFIILIINLTA